MNNYNHKTQYQRINITLPVNIIDLLNKATSVGGRSRFIADSVILRFAEKNKAMSARKRRFQVRPFDSRGLQYGYTYDRINYLIDATEEEYYRKKMSI